MREFRVIAGLALLALAAIGLSSCAEQSTPTATILSIEAPTLSASTPEIADLAPVTTTEASETQAPQATSSTSEDRAAATALPEATASTGGRETPAPTSQAGAQTPCAPTAMDMLGPFYTPGAPIRDKVGEGYVLSGVVRSAANCSPIAGAQIDVWMAGPDGEYKDDFRAILFSQEDGSYRFESHAPPPYSGRPPHIHLLVNAPGFVVLVTQHYPRTGEIQASFDLVLSADS